MKINNLLIVIISISLLIIAFSVAYYLIYYLPQKDEIEFKINENKQIEKNEEKNINLIEKYREECEQELNDKIKELNENMQCSTQECLENVYNAVIGPNYIDNCIKKNIN